MVDPPGTHQDAIRIHEVVIPLVDLAARLDRGGISDDDAVSALLAFPGCDRSALLEAAAAMANPDNQKSVRMAELLRRAASRLG